MIDHSYFLLKYINNWDFYIPKMASAPLPETRREKYNAIMARYRSNEVNGRDVTCELVAWLANFDSENRQKFIDWLACQSRTIAYIDDNHLMKYLFNVSETEMIVLLKSLQAAIENDSLNERMHDAAIKLFGRINVKS